MSRETSSCRSHLAIVITILERHTTRVGGRPRFEGKAQVSKTGQKSFTWDHTNPPHPHHHPFNKFKLEFIKCNNSLNARKTELSLLQFKSFKFIKSDLWGWGGFVWPLFTTGQTFYDRAQHNPVPASADAGPRPPGRRRCAPGGARTPASGPGDLGRDVCGHLFGAPKTGDPSIKKTSGIPPPLGSRCPPPPGGLPLEGRGHPQLGRGLRGAPLGAPDAVARLPATLTFSGVVCVRHVCLLLCASLLCKMSYVVYCHTS